MTNLKNIIDNFKPIDETDEAIKEALQIFLDFFNLKIILMEKEIENNLISGTFTYSDFKVPISNIILKKSQQIIKNQENEYTFIGDILVSLKEIFKCSKDMADVLIKKIENNLIEATKEDGKEIIFSLITPEGTNIIRYDLLFYNKTLNSKKIKEKIHNNFAYIVIKSSVNTRKLVFKDFFSLYSILLKEYFDEDNEKIKNNLTEMRDIYSISLSE